MKGLKIGKVAKEANVKIETIRYYERLGLISEMPRTKAGYRVFPSETIQQIKFIKKAQNLGFILSEIKELLNIANGENYCQDVKNFASIKIQQLEQKILDLEKIKSILQDWSNKCQGSGPISTCPIIEKLYAEEDQL